MCFKVKHEFECERILFTIQICKTYCAYIWHLNDLVKNINDGIKVHFRKLLGMGNGRYVTGRTSYVNWSEQTRI